MTANDCPAIYRLTVGSQLLKAVNQQAPSLGCAAVKPECKLIEIAGKMLRADTSLVYTKPPLIKLGCDTMDTRHDNMGRISASPYIDRDMTIAQFAESAVASPSIASNFRFVGKALEENADERLGSAEEALSLMDGIGVNIAVSGGEDRERPVRTVRITRDFWMGKYEVTQREYQQLTRNNPSHFKGENLPVETVNWNDVVRFCEELTSRERGAGRLPQGYVYRLPTEAEWEYAARGGHRARATTYAGSNDINAVAWYSSNSGGKTHPVGTKEANELGLHDMSGNVWEWCHDWYQDSYSGLSTTDPTGPCERHGPRAPGRGLGPHRRVLPGGVP